MNTWYAVNRKTDTPSEAEVSIYDAIGAYGITAEQFVNDLKAIKAKVINVRLNTPGGEVFDGTAIANAIREHPARVIMHVDGIAASTGSFIATAGDEVRMADNAYMMIHNARAGVMGGAEEMRSCASMLEKVNGNIAGMYQRKAGKDAAHWRGLMDAETWFTAEEAKAAGLVDTVYAAAKSDMKVAKVAANFDFKVYNKIPDPVRHMWGLSAPVAAIEPTIPAPEASPVGELPPAILQEPIMADPVQAAPAQAPAAPATIPTQAQPAPVAGPTLLPAPTGNFASAQDAIENYRQVQAPQYFEQGRKKGFEEATLEATNRLKAIVAVCPGKSDMALTAFLTGQTPEAVKLAFDATALVETRAKEEAMAKDMEIIRLTSLLELGGHQGVSTAMNTSAPTDAPVADPKAHAEQEWDYKPSVRKGFSSKERYVAVRTAELSGQFQMVAASAMPVNG